MGAASPATGQHYVHSAVWLRFAPSYTLNPHWTFLADVWYRRQNDLHAGVWNPLAAPFLGPSGRIGASFRTEHWALTLYPVAIYQSYPALGKQADYARPRSTEIRPHVFAEWSQPLRGQLSFRFRAGYEFRRFADGSTAGRARFRAMLRKELNDRTYTSLWNEVLLPVRPHVAVRQLCEINRTNLALGRNVSNHLTLEAAYQFTYRQRRTLVEFDEEHALTLTGFYRF